MQIPPRFARVPLLLSLCLLGACRQNEPPAATNTAPDTPAAARATESAPATTSTAPPAAEALPPGGGTAMPDASSAGDGPPASAPSPEPGAAMLVLDASGSMAGRIGGRPKIEIAREAVAGMLADWPPSRPMGLMAYGHRSKGDCNDIELLQAPAALDRDGLQAAVDALRPKGMTPLSEAVRRAADALRSEERKATVILISDGEETCKADPCAVGRALEAAGVDFTAHVIGFDIRQGSPAERQLQCLASATGGRYLDAADANTLATALETVATAPPAPRECGRFVGADTFMPGRSTWTTGGHAVDIPETQRKAFDGVEMTADAEPRQCQRLCDDDALCRGWYFEPVGSNFRTLPVCWRWDGGTALSPPGEGPVGSAMGLKPGARLIAMQGGEDCDARP